MARNDRISRGGVDKHSMPVPWESLERPHGAAVDEVEQNSRMPNSERRPAAALADTIVRRGTCIYTAGERGDDLFSPQLICASPALRVQVLDSEYFALPA